MTELKRDIATEDNGEGNPGETHTGGGEFGEKSGGVDKRNPDAETDTVRKSMVRSTSLLSSKFPIFGNIKYPFLGQKQLVKFHWLGGRHVAVK